MPDDELSPEQERVRALLAQARVDSPVPDDVAARLDRVLAQLADEGTAAPDGRADLVDLASRRRRKAATLLVAAAAVVAVGIGIGNVVPSSTDGADSDSATSADIVGEDRPDAGMADGSAPEPEAAGSARLFADSPARVRPDHFADDVAGLRVQRGDDAEQTFPDELASSSTDGAAAFMCDAAAWGPGRLVAVHYGGVPAVLAFRPTTGDTQVVDLLECGSAAILRSVTLPVP